MSFNPAPLISDATAPPWPRRASKACASCRRDKIRCDGSRPCGGCHKKGYTADQCTEGCEPCRRARVRCEEGKPCLRCQEMGLDCMDSLILAASMQSPTLETTMPGGGKQTSPASSKLAARGAERAKLACSNCRRDNKKCDDQRPCSRCIARSEECIHLPRGPKLIKLRCEKCRMDNKRCEEARPCQYCVDAGRTCVTAARKGRGHGNRVKAACVSCRRDKVRCNGDRPCAACTKKGCECVDRTCQACEDGKITDCAHRKLPDVSATSDVEVMLDQPPSPPVKPTDNKPLDFSHLHNFRQSTIMINGYPVPQWESHVPGPYSHPLHPMYPTVVPQAQYYFPPQRTYQPGPPSFPMSVNTSPALVSTSQPTYNYNNDFGRPQVYATSPISNSRDQLPPPFRKR